MTVFGQVVLGREYRKHRYCLVLLAYGNRVKGVQGGKLKIDKT